MQNPKRYTITAALPYANGPIHIGHLAGVYIPGDIYARYLRQKKQDVIYMCGSDEHGVAITIRAKKEGISPQEVVDKYHGIIKKGLEDLGVQFDHYSRTSSEIHHKTASDFFLDLYNKDEFVEKTTEQYFDVEANQFLADRYITGTCPNCSFENAYGDQCENCGTSLSPEELINPKSALSGSKPELRETTHWYLPLDKYQNEFLNDWIDTKKGQWKPNVFGQCKSWLTDGLSPRAITRDLDWGIKVPVEGADGKVLYVWFDAPIGYISATKEWAEKTGKDWEPYWKDEDTKLVHFIGKDNIVFHCIIFPAILKAHGDYILPTDVPANEFLNLEGNKISTSRNWAVWLHEYLEDFPHKQDVLRYVLTATAPETKDNDFTWSDFQTRNNSELVAIFGNFINRVVVLTNKYWEGKVPAQGALSEVDKKVLADLANYPKKIGESIEKYRFREALGELMNLARLGNKYLADEEPWKLIKTDPSRVETIMNIALQIASSLAIVSEPFMPFTAATLSNMLNLPETSWDEAGNGNIIEAEHQINKAELLFAKVEDEEINAQLEKLQNTKTMNSATESNVPAQKPEATFDDFTKLDMRVGTILEAEKVPKADKLLKLLVDTGLDKRTVVSGIAESFTVEEVIGQKVTILLNLAPRKIRGVESQGMILMTENAEGKLVFMSPAADAPNGQQVS